MKLSTEPFSKFEAIFNLEMIKERNRPKLPKSDMPKTPFFLFDLEKVISGDLEGQSLLKPKFFSNLAPLPGSDKLKNHGHATNLKSKLQECQSATDVINYLKTLSPSGIELEFLSLSSFDFSDKNTPENYVSTFKYNYFLKFRFRKCSISFYK